MQRLIEESEKKFQYYWSAKGEKELDITEYLPEDAAGEGQDQKSQSSGSSASFSLSSLTEMDGLLLRDKSFNEMYNDVRRYCSKEFIQSAKHVERYYVLLAGLLRQLLRASGSTFDPYERKILLEMVYRWYRDKRRVLLEQRLKKTKRQRKPVLKKILRQGEQVPQQDQEDEDKPHLKKRRILPTTPVQQRPATQQKGRKQYFDISQSKHLPLFVNREKKKNLFITNKLKQYSRRNLRSSQQMRMQSKEAQAKQQVLQQPPTTPKTSQEQRGLERQRTWGVKSATAPAGSRPQTTPSHSTTQLQSDLPARRELYSQPRLMSYKKPQDFVEMKIYKHWLKHRAREAQEQMEDLNFRNAISTWSFNRARIEEEIQRRQESNRYSSQTGVTLHKIVKRDPKESKRQAAETRKILEQLNDNMDSFLDSDSDFSDDEEEIQMPTNPDTPVDSDADQLELDEEPKEITPTAAVDEEKENIPVFLSPYNPANLKNVKNPLTKPDPPLPINEWMQKEEKDLAARGFSRPSTVSGSTIPRTPIIGYHRSKLVSAPSTAVGDLEIAQPALDEDATRSDQRPSTSNSIFQKLKTKHNPLYLTEVEHVYNKEPGIVHFHSIFDREEFAPKPEKKKKKKGKKKGAKKAPPKKKGKKEEPKKEAPPPVVELPPEPRPPSLLRSAQLDECQRIKVSLAKSGWNVPASVIQRSILIPEDKPYDDCVKDLPTQSFMTFQSIIPEEPKKKKKKGKKKGKKKKKKKKKK